MRRKKNKIWRREPASGLSKFLKPLFLSYILHLLLKIKTSELFRLLGGGEKRFKKKSEAVGKVSKLHPHFPPPPSFFLRPIGFSFFLLKFHEYRLNVSAENEGTQICKCHLPKSPVFMLSCNFQEPLSLSLSHFFCICCFLVSRHCVTCSVHFWKFVSQAPIAVSGISMLKF